MNHTLEQYKAFPYVAWTLVILFAFFTINLTVQLNKEARHLAAQEELV